MKKTWSIVIISAVITSILLSPFLFLFNKRLAYYAYKEVVYRTIINSIVNREKDPEKISFLLLDYFHFYLFSPYKAKVIDKDIYNDLIRGIAWCDQRSWALGTFLGKVGIDNRMVMTRNPQGVSNHTVLEVFINNEWRLFDPYFGFVFQSNSGLVSYEDICCDPSLFYLSPDMLMLKEVNPSKYENVKRFFTRNIFYNNPNEPAIWGNPVKNKGVMRAAISHILDLYISIFGNRFSYFYQDAYLKYFSPHKECESFYFKARNYDLFNRHQLAIYYYKKVINGFRQDPLAEDALFFLGVLYGKAKGPGLSIDAFQILLKEFPDSKWKIITNYYFGYDYELLKNYKLAKECYLKAINMYESMYPMGIKPTELKAVKRLCNLEKKFN